MTLSVFVVIVVALYFGRDVLLPLTLAVLLSIILAPLVAMLRRIWFGRVPSVLAAVLLSVGVIAAVGGLLGSQFVELARNLPTYANTIHQKVDGVKSFSRVQIGHLVEGFGDEPAPAKPVPSARNRQSKAPATLQAGQSPDNTAPVAVEVHQPDPTPMELAQRYIAPALSPLGTAGIVFVVTIFILLQQEDLRDRLIRLFGSHDLRRTTVALDDGGRRLSRYFITQLGINTAFGTIIGIGLAVIGLPSPLLWAVFAGLLRFVPYVGSFISAAFPMVLAAAIEPGWSMVLWTAALFFIVEGTIGQMVEPMVYGHSTGLSPISVVVAAIFWSWLWGPVGLILSTPLTLCLVVLGRHVERLKFLDVMLGDRPALTPVEGFYQRMLAADPDEARYHAEQMLKDRSLLSYYDDVALRGLELAAIDTQRGTLNDEQLERIKETIKDLVADLDDYVDKPTEPQTVGPEDAAGTPSNPQFQTLVPVSQPDHRVSWHNDAKILCVAGRGPLDEAASSMLCQLLSRSGFSTQIAPYRAVTRGNINLLDIENVEIICVSYLDISGKQAHLRYLLQRLRLRLPNVPLLVGLWPEDHPTIKDRNSVAQSKDYFVSSLREAIEACERIADHPKADPGLEKLSA